jgi:hypothetical protein
MIIEHRTYTLPPGKLPEFIRIYEELGAPVQIPILGNLIAVMTTEVGPLNQIIHLWGYEDYADREKRRAELAQHPDWPKYLAKAVPLLEKMETKICVPASYSPIK